MPDIDLVEERRASQARGESEMVRSRARRVIAGRWNATPDELREAIAEKYPKRTDEEREGLLVVALDVQRLERHSVADLLLLHGSQEHLDRMPLPPPRPVRFSRRGAKPQRAQPAAPPSVEAASTIPPEEPMTESPSPVRGYTRADRPAVIDEIRKQQANGTTSPSKIKRAIAECLSIEIPQGTMYNLISIAARPATERLSASPEAATAPPASAPDPEHTEAPRPGMAAGETKAPDNEAIRSAGETQETERLAESIAARRTDVTRRALGAVARVLQAISAEIDTWKSGEAGATGG